jgi:hypothetical protein
MKKTTSGTNGAVFETKGAPLQIEIPALDVGIIKVRVVGTTPLIVHNWSAKAKKEMLDKQTKVAKSKKEAKDPEADFKASLYMLPGGGYGFPSIGLKSAIVDACAFVANIPKTQARGVLHIAKEFITIKGSPTMREDMVKVGKFPGVADLRYRAEFKEWESEVEISFLRNVVSADQIINLIRYAGFTIGIGEWRPEKNGTFGTFRVESTNRKEAGRDL